MNPKDSVGAKKAPTRYVPQALVLEVAPVMANGAAKYGPFNWRQQPVSAITYAEAIQRHLSAWVDGQDDAEDSGLSHIAHIAASCGILLDAKANASLLDDRTPGPAADILRRLDKSVAPAPPVEADEVGTQFMCGHRFGEEPTEGCGLAHWSRVSGVEQVQSVEFRPVGELPDLGLPENVPAIVAVCEDSGNHIPGRHLLACPDFS